MQKPNRTLLVRIRGLGGLSGKDYRGEDLKVWRKTYETEYEQVDRMDQ